MQTCAEQFKRILNCFWVQHKLLNFQEIELYEQTTQRQARTIPQQNSRRKSAEVLFFSDEQPIAQLFCLISVISYYYLLLTEQNIMKNHNN